MSKKAYNETPEFFKQQSEWYARLKKSGFDDIEKNEPFVRPQIIDTRKTESMGGNGYYDFCQSILRDFKFSRPVDRLVFELHADGKSIRFIEDYLKTNSVRKLKKDAIHDIIKRTKETFLKGPTK